MNQNTRDADISTLNDLTALCLDSCKGYKEAADLSKNPSLSTMFRARAQERQDIAREFQSQVTEFGGTPVDHGTIAGAAHRVMLDVMAMVGNDTKVAINEVERGEDVIKAAFEKAIKNDDICDKVRSMVTQNYTSIKAGHDQVSALKRSAA